MSTDKKRLDFNGKEVINDVASINSIAKNERANPINGEIVTSGSIIKEQILTATKVAVGELGRDLPKAAIEDVLYAFQKTFTQAAEAAAKVVEQAGVPVFVYTPIGNVKFNTKSGKVGDTKILLEIADLKKNGAPEAEVEAKTAAYNATLAPYSVVNGSVSVKIREGELVGGIHTLKARNLLSEDQKAENKTKRDALRIEKKKAALQKELEELG